MGRKKRAASTGDRAVINFKADEKMTAYLHALVSKGGYGNTPTTAAQGLIWEGIRARVRDSWIKDVSENPTAE